jgi:hypothetical protein
MVTVQQLCHACAFFRRFSQLTEEKRVSADRFSGMTPQLAIMKGKNYNCRDEICKIVPQLPDQDDPHVHHVCAGQPGLQQVAGRFEKRIRVMPLQKSGGL